MLLWTGSAVSALGTTVSTIGYPLLVLAVTGSPARAGVAGSVATLPYLLFQLPAGVLVDRLDRRRTMLCCDAVRAAGLVSIVVALLLHQLRFGHILVVGFVEGTLSVCHGLAANAAVANIMPADRTRQALSLEEARQRAAVMLGQPLGGILFGIARVLPFAVDAVSYVVSAVTVGLIRKRFQQEPAAPPAHPVRQAWEGILWIWRQPFLRVANLATAGSNLLFPPLYLVIIVKVTSHGGSPTVVGMIVGVAGTGGVLGSVTAPWWNRRHPLPTLAVGVNWAWAALFLAVAVSDSLVVLGAASALMWYAGAVWNVAFATHQTIAAPDHIRGCVQGAGQMLMSGAVPLGSLAGGLLLGAAGPRLTTLVFAGWMVLLAGVVTLSRSAGAPRAGAPATSPPTADRPPAAAAPAAGQPGRQPDDPRHISVHSGQATGPAGCG